MTWQEQAACAGVPLDWFFPPATSNALADPYLRGRKVCARCPVVDRCLQYAFDNGCRDGMFGGKDPIERGARKPPRPTRGPTPRVDPVQLAQQRRELWLAGYTDADIASTIGVSVKTVQNWRSANRLAANTQQAVS